MAREMSLRWGTVICEVTEDAHLAVINRDAGTAVHLTLDEAHALLQFLLLAIAVTDDGVKWEGD